MSVRRDSYILLLRAIQAIFAGNNIAVVHTVMQARTTNAGANYSWTGGRRQLEVARLMMLSSADPPGATQPSAAAQANPAHQRALPVRALQAHKMCTHHVLHCQVRHQARPHTSADNFP